MTRDDIRKLIGGYATGSLTEAERKILFEAALDDQELFDELAREQALKELLDEPGAKQRLIAGLKPRSAPAWRRPLAWVGAMVVAAGVVVTGWLALRPIRPVQVAQVSPAAAPVPQAVDVVTGSSAPSPAPQKVAPRRKIAPAQRAEEKNVVAAPSAAGPVVTGALTDQSTGQPVISARSNVSAARGGGGMGGAMPRAASPAVPSAFGTPLAEPRPMSVSGAGNRAELAQAAPAPMAKAVPRFGFSYSLGADGVLVVTAASDGYLSVGTIFPETFVARDSITRIDLAKSQSLLRPMAGLANPEAILVHFSAKKGAAGNAAPIERNTATGTVEDPNPSPDSSLTVAITVK